MNLYDLIIMRRCLCTALQLNLNLLRSDLLSCESENLSKKAASGLLRAAEKMNITVDPDLGLVYAFQGMNCTLTFGGGITCNEDGLERLREDYPESAADIRYIIDNMKGYATGPKVFDAFSQTELDLLHSGSLWGGTWTGHAVPRVCGDRIPRNGLHKEKGNRVQHEKYGKRGVLRSHQYRHGCR